MNERRQGATSGQSASPKAASGAPEGVVQQLVSSVWRGIGFQPAPPPTDPRETTMLQVVDPGDIVAWAQDRFYVTETKRPIVLQPVQQRVLQLFTERREDGRFRWKTCLYSTIKKSGKTTIAALYQRWAAEMWGDFGEIFHIGNKLTQAKERAFKLTEYSIILAPKHERQEWDIQTTQLTYAPGNSFIKAIPVSASGEAGSNQRFTTWTEFHGYSTTEDERMWSEMQPVPTQPLSQRFVESYAGYEGESNLLENLWNQGLDGELLDDEYPIYGNETAGLIAYIDTGIEARRMPWQLGPAGQQYYAEAEKTELPHEFRRIHLNAWVSSKNSVIEMPAWDGLKMDANRVLPPEKKKTQWVVVAADASISGDCTALVVVTIPTLTQPRAVEVANWIWTPSKGKKLDYDDTIQPQLREVLSQYRVRCVTYDQYQLHSVMTTLAKRFPNVTFHSFPQGVDRVKADTEMVRRIQQGEIGHSGSQEARDHVQSADGKAVSEKTIRFVKRSLKGKIDYLVALSMGVYKAFEYARYNSPQDTEIPEWLKEWFDNAF